MSVCIIGHSACAKHEMGQFHPESPARLKAITQHLADSPFYAQLDFLNAEKARREHILLAHESAYVNDIFSRTPTSGSIQLDPDTSMNRFSLNAALYSAGAAIKAVDTLFKGKHCRAFCATRPPGHHAERSKAMGFCIFNNIAIAAIYAQQKYKCEKMAILDFDVHHGNGTEEIVSDKEGILFCSTFQHPFYPFSGSGPHASHIINTPLPANAGSTEFRNAVSQYWLPALNEYRPELILISAGFDAHAEDEMSQVRLMEHDYEWVTDQLTAISKKYCEDRIISVLEGGYSLNALGRSVVAHIKSLLR